MRGTQSSLRTVKNDESNEANQEEAKDEPGRDVAAAAPEKDHFYVCNPSLGFLELVAGELPAKKRKKTHARDVWTRSIGHS
jgi:hypothetical protein